MEQSGDTELCGVHLAAPLILASGGLGESASGLAPYQRPSVGAVVTRTLRIDGFAQRRQFPVPHLHIERRGRYVLNCEWGNQNGFRYWSDEGFAEAASRGPVIASVSGRDPEDCARVCRLLPPELVELVEVNVSCSHSGKLFGQLTDDAARIEAATRAAASSFPRPPIVKLGWSPHVAAMADVAASSGAGAIAVTNTIGPGLDVDLASKRAVLGLTGGFGGVSGPAIFPLALQAVAEVARRVDVPVVGIGGVSTWEEAAKMVLVGASAVGVYTAAMLRGPTVFDRIHTGLVGWLQRNDVSNLNALRGLAVPQIEAPTRFDGLVPLVDTERCTPCPACSRVCPADAITVAPPAARIDPGRCTGCGACVGACPPRRDAISFP